MEISRKEISRELLDILLKVIGVPVPKIIEDQLKADGIKIIEPDYLVRARMHKREGETHRNFECGFFELQKAIENYEKHIKQLEEKDNGRE